MSRDSFVFYKSWAEILSGVRDDVRLSVYDAVVEYATNGTMPTLEPTAMMAFMFIRDTLDRDEARWNETKQKRSEAGKKGNEARWGNKAQNIANIAKGRNAIKLSQTSQKVANVAVNVNVNDNVNVNNKESTLTSTKESEDNSAVPPVGVTTLSQEETATEKKIKSRIQREQEFYQELIPYIDTYGKDMIREFYDYWTEPTKSKTLIRKDQQKTWDTARRLATWSKRQNNYGNDNKTRTDNQLSGDAKTAAAMLSMLNDQY